MKTQYKEMNIRELQNFVTAKNPKTIMYSTENSDTVLSPVHQKLKFTKITFALPSNPNTIVLKCSCGQMIFDNIYYIGVSTEGVFDVLKIRCELTPITQRKHTDSCCGIKIRWGAKSPPLIYSAKGVPILADYFFS